MIDVSYEKLYRAIYPTLPADWQRVVIRAAFRDGSSSIKYYVQQHSGEYCDCFELVTDQATVLEIIANLHYSIAATRNSLTDKNRWNAITVAIEADGSFHSDFDYTEQDWGAVDTINEWERKYLIV